MNADERRSRFSSASIGVHLRLAILIVLPRNSPSKILVSSEVRRSLPSDAEDYECVHRRHGRSPADFGHPCSAGAALLGVPEYSSAWTNESLVGSLFSTPPKLRVI